MPDSLHRLPRPRRGLKAWRPYRHAAAGLERFEAALREVKAEASPALHAAHMAPAVHPLLRTLFIVLLWALLLPAAQAQADCGHARGPAATTSAQAASGSGPPLITSAAADGAPRDCCIGGQAPGPAAHAACTLACACAHAGVSAGPASAASAFATCEARSAPARREAHPRPAPAVPPEKPPPMA